MIDTTPYDNFDDFFTWYLKIVESKVPNYLALDSDLIHNKFGALTQQEFEFTCKKIREIYPLPKRIKLVNDNSLGTFYAAWDEVEKRPYVAFPSVMMYWLRYPPIVKGIIDHELGHTWGTNPDILSDKTKYPDGRICNISMDVRINQNINYDVLEQIYKCVATFDRNPYELQTIPEYWMPKRCLTSADLKTKATWTWLYKLYFANPANRSLPPKEEELRLNIGDYVETLVDKHGFPTGTFGIVSEVLSFNEYVISEITNNEKDAILNDDFAFFENHDSFFSRNQIGNYTFKSKKTDTVTNEIKKIPIPFVNEKLPKLGDFVILIVDKPTISKGKFGIISKVLSIDKYEIKGFNSKAEAIIRKKDFEGFAEYIKNNNAFDGSTEECIYGKEFILYEFAPPSNQPPQPPKGKEIKRPKIGDVVVIEKGEFANRYGVITSIDTGTKSDGSDSKYTIKEISEEIVKIKTGRL